MEQWTFVCNRLLNGKDREIRLWNDLIKIELRARAKVREESWIELMRCISIIVFCFSKYFMFVSINSIKVQPRK